jgi:antitoxin PrlF
MTTAAVTSKGQITIPIEVRKKHGIKTGDRLDFTENEKGELVLRPKSGSAVDLIGIANYKGPVITIEEMNKAIREGWASGFKEEG